MKETSMTSAAKTYIALVVTAGLALLAAALYMWESANPTFYLSFLVLALLGSTRKIRLPGMTATMSLNFLFLLIAVTEFSFSETIVLATATALLQSLWKPAKPPRPVQVAFGAATMAAATGLVVWVLRLVFSSAPAQTLPARLLLATALLLLVNTGLVAGVLALVEKKRLAAVWRECYMLAFPYFVIGAGLAGAICSSCSAMGWQFALLLLPSSYLLYLFYRFLLERQAREGRFVSSENAAD